MFIVLVNKYEKKGAEEILLLRITKIQKKELNHG